MKLSPIAKNFFLRVINMTRPSCSHFVLLFILLTSLPVLSQDGNFRPSRTEAETAWNAGNYEAAYKHYNTLLLLYSRDPSYKYFTGACLVKLERDPSRAVTLLGSAINSSLNVKTVPDDVWFYYGRALQMNQRLTEASEAYEKFIKLSGKRRALEYKAQIYFEQCMAGLPADDKDELTALFEETAVTQDNTTVPVLEEYDDKLTKAVSLQFTSDSLTRAALLVRKEIENAAPETKEALRRKAESLDKKASEEQAEADEIYMALEPGNTNLKPVSSEVKAESESESEAESESESEVETEAEAENDSVNPVFSVFDVRVSPAYSEANPIPIGKDAPAGLVYRIQLAAFKNPIQPSYFKGLYPVYGKVKPENGVTYYYAGMFRTVESARQALQKVRTAGFPDAFVAAMIDDALVSMDRALALEQEWGRKPLLYEKVIQQMEQISAPADTIPLGTLYFRAEVIRSRKPLKAEVTERVGLLAGRRGLDIIKNNQGETLYLIGNFITFESADEYVSLLIRNGYSAAKVVAYVGTREIAVESARELLKKLKDD